MKKKIFYSILFFLLFSCSRQAVNNIDTKYKDYTYSSESGNTLVVSIPDFDVYSHESLKIILKVAYKKELVTQMPDWSLLKDSLNIVDINETYGPVEIDDIITRILEITLGPQLPGDYLLNPLNFSFSEKGKAVDNIQTEYIPISIKSSLIPGEKDIIDDFVFIKDKNKTLFILLILIIIFICAFIIFIIKKQKINEDGLKIEKDYISLIENIQSKDIKEIYLILSQILKEFIDNKLYLPIQSQTTEEFIYFSRNLPFVEEWLKIQLYSFLQRSDEARFGLKTPDKERAKGDILFCREFVKYVNNKIAQEIPI